MKPQQVRAAIERDRLAGESTPLVALADAVIRHLAANDMYRTSSAERDVGQIIDDEAHHQLLLESIRAESWISEAVRRDADGLADDDRFVLDLLRDIDDGESGDPNWQQKVLARIDADETKKRNRWWRRLWRRIRGS
jgi:hypothetical protein